MNLLFRARRSRRALAALAIVASIAIWAGMAGGDSPEAREVKEQFTRRVGQIASLEVSYSLAATSGLKPAELRALSAFRNQLYLPQEDWTEAFKGEKRYQHQLLPERVDYLSAIDEFGIVAPQPVDPRAPEAVRKNQKALRDSYDRATALAKAQEARGVPGRRKKDPGPLDPMERDITRAFNGRMVWMRRPRDEKTREVQVWPLRREAMHWFGMSAYLSAVGLQPTDPTSKGHQVQKAQEMYRLADWFKNYAHTIEKTETFDGSTCVVLKGSLNDWYQSLAGPFRVPKGDVVDRIWLDRDHGWTLRKRELTKDGQIVERWETAEPREVEPGVWLPTVVRRERFAEDAPAQWRGKPVVTEEIRVKRIEVNRVRDDQFDMVPEKGDVIEDMRGMF